MSRGIYPGGDVQGKCPDPVGAALSHCSWSEATRASCVSVAPASETIQ